MMKSYPPGPKSHWLTGHLAGFRQSRLGFLTQCAREHGDAVRLRVGPRQLVLFSHPELLEEVFVAQNRHFVKHFALKMSPLVLGDGLLSSDGDLWVRQRRIIQPAFQRQRIAGHAAVMTAYTERMLNSWQSGDTRNVFKEMSCLALEIAAKTLFDVEAGGEANVLVGNALKVLTDAFINRVNKLLPLPQWFPTPENIRLRRAIRWLDQVIYGFIARHRKEGGLGTDFLSILLHARDEHTKTGMTDKQLRDEAMTLFLAGHETTALVLTWTWYALARNPEVQERLADEARRVLGSRPVTAADWPHLPYAERVVKETMRLYPPVYVVGREATRDVDILGYPVPRGATALMSQWVVHRDARFWDNPEEFIPERWTEAAERARPRFAYFPFGGGPRVCIGNHFAMMEAVLVLATIARRYHFSLVDATPITPIARFTLRPERPIIARLTERRRQAAAA